MKKLFLYGILLIVMLSVAVVGVRAINVENGTCVIIPNQGSNAEHLGQGVENQAGSVCDATADGGCGACIEQCIGFRKIKNSYGCDLCGGDGFCNPMCETEEDPDCIVEVVPDQVNDVPASISIGCGNPPDGNLFQSFTPSASSLTAVDLRLRAGGDFPDEGYSTTINIRSGTPSGTILGTATTLVLPPTIGNQLMVNFEFSPPLEVTLGQTYVVELISPNQAILGWMVDGDTYFDGNAFGCWEVPISDWDFIFITYTTA